MMRRSLLVACAVVAVVAVALKVGGWELSGVVAYPVAATATATAFIARWLR